MNSRPQFTNAALVKDLAASLADDTLTKRLRFYANFDLLTLLTSALKN